MQYKAAALLHIQNCAGLAVEYTVLGALCRVVSFRLLNAEYTSIKLHQHATHVPGSALVVQKEI